MAATPDDEAAVASSSGWSSTALWRPFALSCVSGLSTVLGAAVVLLRARLTATPLTSAHLAFTSGLACSVMLVVSLAQMLLPAALTSPHRIGPAAATSICAASAALCLLAIRQAPIDRLLAWLGLSAAAVMPPGAASSSAATLSPPLPPPHSMASGTTSPPSRPSSPSRHVAAVTAEQDGADKFNTPPFLQRHASSSSSGRAEAMDERSPTDGSGVDSGGEGGRDDVRLLIAGDGSVCGGVGSSSMSSPRHRYFPPAASSASHSDLLRVSAPFPSSNSTLRLGVLTALLLAVHNLPEGLAVFVSSFDDTQAGLSMALALSAHNIPEGLIIAVPIFASTRSAWLTVWWTAASGLAEPLGALLALTVLQPHLTHRLMQQLLCAVSGVMLTVALVELFPAGRAYKQPRAMQAGMVSGALFIVATSALTTALW